MSDRKRRAFAWLVMIVGPALLGAACVYFDSVLGAAFFGAWLLIVALRI